MNSIRKVREDLKNPKKKSLTLLGIYAIFFIIVFILIGMSNSTVGNYREYIPEKEPIDTNLSDKEESTLNYKYIYKIYHGNEIYEIIGTHKDNIDNFTYNGNDYISRDNIYYLNNSIIDLDIDINKYSYETLELLIDNSDSETKYKDSDNILYNISVAKYFELLNEDNKCINKDCTNILIPITIKKDEYIYMSTIDLSKYYDYRYIIEIEYESVNNT